MGNGLLGTCSRDARELSDLPPIQAARPAKSISGAWAEEEEGYCQCGGSSSSTTRPRDWQEWKTAKQSEEEVLNVSQINGHYSRHTHVDPAAMIGNDGHPEMAWLNFALVEVWPYAREAVVTLLEEQVLPDVAKELPAPLHNIRLARADLGEKPPKLGKVLYYRKQKQRHRGVELDIDLDWKVDADIELEVPGIISVGITKLIVSGAVSIVLRPLMDTLPIVGGIQIFMINDPCLDWHFTGAASVVHFPVIEEKVRSVVMQSLREQLVLPNRLFYHWIYGREHEVDINALFHPRPESLARIWLIEAKDLSANPMTGSRNPYGILRIGERSHQTKILRHQRHPHWGDDDAYDFAVYNQMQFVNLDLYDDDNWIMEDTVIGSLKKVTVEDVAAQDPETWWPIYHEKKKGETVVTGHVRLKCVLYDFKSVEHLQIPPAIGLGKTTCLLTLQFRGLKGLPKEYSEGAVLEVGLEGQKYKSEPAVYFEAMQDMVYDAKTQVIDPVVQRLAESLQEHGMEANEIATIAGLDAPSLKKALQQRPAFTTRWQKGIHLFVESPMQSSISLRLILPRTPKAKANKDHVCPPIVLEKDLQIFEVAQMRGMTEEDTVDMNYQLSHGLEIHPKLPPGPFELALSRSLHGMVPCTERHAHVESVGSMEPLGNTACNSKRSVVSDCKSHDVIEKKASSSCCCFCCKRSKDKGRAARRVRISTVSDATEISAL